jgi:predicted nucleic acid-binding protein
VIRILIDTNVILDIALERQPFFKEASQIFDLIDEGVVIANVTATTITDIYYISKRSKGHKDSIAFIQGLVEIVDIIGIDKQIVLKSLESDIGDFEDAIQISAAQMSEIDTIVTRNQKDFTNINITVQSPEEFLSGARYPG